MTNIYRQAKQLLDMKDNGAQLTDDELHFINTAIIPLMSSFDGGITIGEGLDELAKMTEEKKE